MGAHALMQIHDAAARANAGVWLRPGGAPGQSRRAQRAQRALHEAGSVPCAVAHSRASSISPPAIGTERDASAGRCGAVWGCRAGRSRVAEVLRQRRARAAQAAHGPWAAAPPTALWHGSVAADRRPARRPPSVKHVPMRNGAAASPTGARTARRGPHAGAPARERVLLVCLLGGVRPSMKVGVSRGASALLPRDDAAAEHVRVAPQGPLESPAPRGPRVEPRGARVGRNRARRVA